MVRSHDLRLDLTGLGVRTSSIDLVVAVHVLEHIRDDHAALSEIRRILAPGGYAVLAVPIVADSTREYASPSTFEHGHVRAPGVDYYGRLGNYFDDVCVYSSGDVSQDFQTYIYEDRSVFPNSMAPERPSQNGICHSDSIAIAHAAT